MRLEKRDDDEGRYDGRASPQGLAYPGSAQAHFGRKQLGDEDTEEQCDQNIDRHGQRKTYHRQPDWIGYLWIDDAEDDREQGCTDNRRFTAPCVRGERAYRRADGSAQTHEKGKAEGFRRAEALTDEESGKPGHEAVK